MSEDLGISVHRTADGANEMHLATSAKFLACFLMSLLIDNAGGLLRKQVSFAADKGSFMAIFHHSKLRIVIYGGIYGGALATVVLCGITASAEGLQSLQVVAQAASGTGQGSNPQTSTSTSTFDDWIVRCETKPPAPKVCEAVQTIAARNQQQQKGVIAEVVFGRLTKTDPFKLIIQLPPGVYLPSGASLVLDDKTPPLAAMFTRCLQTCMAEAELKPDVVQMLKNRTKAEPGRIEFNDGARRKVTLPLSFKGLPAALAARDDQAQ